MQEAMALGFVLLTFIVLYTIRQEFFAIIQIMAESRDEIAKLRESIEEINGGLRDFKESFRKENRFERDGKTNLK